MKKQNVATRIIEWMKSHRKTSILIIIVIVGGCYWIYKTVFPTVTIPQYTLAMARIGSITQTVTGSGQVSASNQTDIQSQVSGTIKTINVSVGEAVHAGELLATIDSANAAISLQNSRISLEKLTKPAKETDISNAQSNLAKTYDSGWNTIAGTFLDLPTIVSGMKDLLYGQDTFLNDINSASLSSLGKSYREKTGISYDSAVNQYQKTLLEYNTLNRNSATSSIDQLLDDTYATIKSIADATTNAQNAINYIITTQSDYQKSSAATTLANVTSWANLANTDVANIVSAKNSILSSSNSLLTLIAGSDTLDIQSSRLSLEQAQRTYDNYFIRAPYDGVIGRIPVNVFGQAGSGTTIATIVGQQKIASISLNEVDAAKVRVGQTVKITFDAIDSLNATGTVSVVDQIGTVASGVVSYGVKILINTSDDRIKPGMSVNTSIITLQKDGVMVIPSSAIKKQGNESYVQTFDAKTIQVNLKADTASNKTDLVTTNQTSLSTSSRNRNLTNTTRTSSSTISQTYIEYASSTRNFGNINLTARATTISTTVLPTKVTVTTGDSDDTNTEILSGLNRGEFVVTKTTGSSGAQTTTAPSILSSFGANRNAGGATRVNVARPGN